MEERGTNPKTDIILNVDWLVEHHRIITSIFRLHPPFTLLIVLHQPLPLVGAPVEDSVHWLDPSWQRDTLS